QQTSCDSHADASIKETEQLKEKPNELNVKYIKQNDVFDFSKLNNSCKPYAHNPGIYTIYVPGLMPFLVPCIDNSKASPGWTVIQQRLNGGQEFQRDWNTYRDGFGYLNEDYFLGLNKIHYITHSQPHELYIRMQKFNDEWYFVHYDNFRVGSEDDLFELQSVGKYTGTHEDDDYFGYSKNVKFTTYDRDNDDWDTGNCAKDEMSGGWWYTSCAACNLNGKYFPIETEDEKSIHWRNRTSLKRVQMLIRPIN
ncbi:maker631, partial [Drosophila busckii]